MTASDIDEALHASNPWRDTDDSALALAAAELAADARIVAAASRRRRARRALWIAPIAAFGTVALTAGTLVLAGDLLRAEIPIPIEYTTDTGRTISCTATIEGGSYFAPREDDVVAYYRDKDVTGIGQRIYDYAMVLAGERAPSPELLPRSSTVIADDKGNAYSEASAFSFSLTSFLLTDAILEMGIDGSGGAWLQSDCTAELH